MLLSKSADVIMQQSMAALSAFQTLRQSTYS